MALASYNASRALTIEVKRAEIGFENLSYACKTAGIVLSMNRSGKFVGTSKSEPTEW